MKKIIFKTLAVIVLAGTLLISCSKGKEEEVDMDTNTTLDNANAQSVSDDALKLTEDILTVNNSAKVAAGAGQGLNCATVDSIKQSSTHYQFTITFNSACTGYDGKLRSGVLLVDLNGVSYNTPGAVITITTSNYTVNGLKFSGKKTITCLAAGKHDIVVSDEAGSGFATITYLSGQTAKWRTKRTRTLVEGGGTVTIADNIYDISVSASQGNPVAEGYNRENRHYVVNINSPIRIDFTCLANNTARYPTQGILQLIPDGKIARTVNYGSGACDNEVVVSIGQKSFDVNLSY